MGQVITAEAIADTGHGVDVLCDENFSSPTVALKLSKDYYEILATCPNKPAALKIAAALRAQKTATPDLRDVVREMRDVLRRIVFDWDGEPEDMADVLAAIAKAEGVL